MKKIHACISNQFNGENPCVQACDCRTLSHTTTVNHGDQTRVAAVRTSALSTTLLGHQFNKNSNTDFFKYFTVTKYKEYKS